MSNKKSVTKPVVKSAKKSAKVAAVKKPEKVVEKRVKRLSFQDVQITFLTDGSEAVRNLMKAGRASKVSLQKALVGLQAKGNPAKALVEITKEFALNTVRGRPSVKIGDERTYRAQQINSGVFLHLPVGSLGVKKGSLLRVKFEADRIIVSRV